MGAHLNDNSPLHLGELIDLEARLQADRSHSRAALHARDERIAAQVNAQSLEDRALLRRWLLATNDGESVRPGAAAMKITTIAKWLAACGGFLLGFAIVAGWLSIESGRPVNAIHFWGALVGLQVMMILMTIMAMLPISSSSRLFETAAGIVGGLLTRVASKLAHETRDNLFALLGRGRETERIYGKVRFWQMMDLSQSFALMVNVGIVAAFVLIPLFSDPAFGWRSTLLESEQVHRATQIISTPWASWWPGGELSHQDVVDTRYSSLDDAFAPEAQDAFKAESWGRWWPFLLLSLIFYAVLPRFITSVYCDVQYRRAIRHIRLDQSELLALRDRLLRPHVSTQAENGDDAGNVETLSSHRANLWPGPALSSLSADQWIVLPWAGTFNDETAMRDRLSSTLSGVVQSIQPIGGNVGADAAAIEAVKSSPTATGAAIIVPASMPPTGEYIDLIQSVRDSRTNAPFVVLLSHQNAQAEPLPPAPQDASLWFTRLSQLTPINFTVAPLIEGSDI